MPKHHNLLIAPAALAAVFCARPAAADDLKIAISEPRSSEELREEAKLLKDQFNSTISKSRGFQVFDRANISHIMGEHEEVRKSGHYPDEEARALGEFKGADFVVTSELTTLGDGAIRITAQALSIVTARVVGSENKLVETPSSKSIREASLGVMEELLKQVNVSMSGRNAADAPEGVLENLRSEIHRVFANNKSIPKWAANKKNYALDVDLSGVRVAENRQYGTARVTGRIYFTLTDGQNGNGGGAELELQPFTEMGKTLIQKKIREQVQQKSNVIIRNLLAELD
jgi:hypothetical protein